MTLSAGRVVGIAVVVGCTILSCRSHDAAPKAAAREPAAALEPAHAGAKRGDSRDCGALGCRLYDSPSAAFAAVMESKPRVLAVGEAHAQRGAPDVPTATERFRTQLLPSLSARASDIVVELWGPAVGCKQAVAQVAQQQKAVTQTQKKKIPGEFTRLATEARKLGITPHHLKPSCDDYAGIAGAGDGDIDAMLTLVARLTDRDIKRLLESHSEADATNTRLVIAYGGALHNDVSPRSGSQEWSFGPSLAKHTAGEYVALDLIVPEYIVDAPPWQALPWVAHFDAAAHRSKTTLFNPEPGSYVLVFPSTQPVPRVTGE
jgi:hypothetical protein